jgi:hypothetical protein
MQTATIIGVVGTANAPTGSAATVGSYIVPASTGAAITQLFCANKTGSSANVAIIVTNGTLAYYLCANAPVAAYDTLDVLANTRLVLAAGWFVTAQASVANTFDVTMSVTQFV